MAGDTVKTQSAGAQMTSDTDRMRSDGAERPCDTVRNKVVSALSVRRQIMYLKFVSALLLTTPDFAGWQTIATPSVIASYALAACLIIGAKGALRMEIDRGLPPEAAPTDSTRISLRIRLYTNFYIILICANQ